MPLTFVRTLSALVLATVEGHCVTVMDIVHASRCWGLKDDAMTVHVVRKRVVDTTLDDLLSLAYVNTS